MIEIQVFHLVWVALGSILTMGLTVWKIVHPLFKSIRDNDKWKSDADHKIENLQQEVVYIKQEMRGRHTKFESLIEKSFAELRDRFDKMDERYVEIASDIRGILESRSESRVRVESLEHRVKKLEETK